MVDAFVRTRRRETARRPRRNRGGLGRIALWAVAIVVGILFVAPYLVMLVDSLRPNSEILSTPTTFLPSKWQFSAYVEVLTDDRFQSWIANSLVVATTSTLIVIIVAIGVAYVTSRFTFPGKRAMILLLLVTQMLSPTTLVVGLYREFFDLGLINTLLALIITNAAFNLAFAVLILDRVFSEIPAEIMEAAELDGASRFVTLIRVVLPLAGPALVTAVIFSFIMAWNEYVLALTLVYGDSMKPLTVGISSYVTGYEQHWDQMFAASIIGVIPVIILFALIEKHLTSGLTAGAIK